MPSVKQGAIKYQFWGLWYDLTRDWTPVSRAIGEHSNRRANTYIYGKTIRRMKKGGETTKKHIRGYTAARPTPKSTVVVSHTQPFHSNRMLHKVNFYAEFNRFEFRVFFLLDRLPYKGKKASLSYYCTHNRIENCLIHTFLTGVLTLCKMQTAPFGVRIRVAEFTANSDNRYAISTLSSNVHTKEKNREIILPNRK